MMKTAVRANRMRQCERHRCASRNDAVPVAASQFRCRLLVDSGLAAVGRLTDGSRPRRLLTAGRPPIITAPEQS